MFLPGDVSIDPPAIEIPADQEPVSKWPYFDLDPRVGRRTFLITYTVTADSIAIGGGIRMAFACRCDLPDNPNLERNDGWLLGPGPNLALFPIGAFQTRAPTKPNYTTATVSTPGAQLVLDTIVGAPDGATFLQIHVTKRALKLGDRIRIVFGETGFGGPGASVSFHPGRPSLVVFEDPEGDGTFVASPDPFPELVVTGSSPDALRINLPVTAIEGEPFSGTLEVVQGRDEPATSLIPVEGFTGKLRLEEPVSGWSTTLDFDPSMRGVARFDATFPDAGVARIHAVEVLPDGTDGSLTGWSNPVVVRSSHAETAIYCGDLHRHACEGGHAAVPHQAAWRTLWDNGQDFGAVLEHAHTEYAGFRHANAVAAAFQALVDPQATRFVAFPGYEWTLTSAHRHVVLADFDDQPALVDRPYEGAEDPPPLLRDTVPWFLSDIRTPPGGPRRIAIPHHSLWHVGAGAPYDWGPQLDDAAQPLVEIMSDHGCSERNFEPPIQPSDYVFHGDPAMQRPADELASVQAALAQGRRFGFVGGSDNHAAAIGMTFLCDEVGDFETSLYARGGLTFVVGERSTPALRDRIWEGITKRRTYVTTGARMFVDWRVLADGRRRGPGGQIGGRRVRFLLDVLPAAVASDRIPGIARHELWRDGFDLVVAEDHVPPLAELDVEMVDPAPPRDGKLHPYYVKVIQDDHHVAWASPIWVQHHR